MRFPLLSGKTVDPWLASSDGERFARRLSNNRVSRICLAIFLLCPTTAFCSSINVGFISFDEFIPAGNGTSGVNFFNVLNFTGGLALPPDFPATDALVFLNSSLTLVSGGSPVVILLGDIGPGSFTPTDQVQFPFSSLFTGAVFNGTLNRTSFIFSGGGTFTVSSTAITANLFPSSGATLTPGTDFAVITVTSADPPSTVPEPYAAPMMGAAALILLIAARRMKYSA